MKAIGYCRVSTDRQANEGESLENQQAKIRQYCDLRGFELVDIHVDAGISGKRADNRPALQDALEAVCEHKGVLIVYSLSRLARSVKDAIEIAERLHSCGADLAVVTQSIDTTTAVGKAFFQITAVFDELERNRISERVSAIAQHKKRKGERFGSVPFGYDVAGDDKTLVKNVGEQETIDLMRELRSGGASFRAICHSLEDSGIPTKKGHTTWTPTAVRNILLAA